jgi:hypothetical protein
MPINAAASNYGADNCPPTPIGLPTLAKLAFDGMDLAPIWNTLVGQVINDAGDTAALIDLSTIAHLQGRPADRLALQRQALEINCIYRQPSTTATARPIKLLAFMAPGDFMANIPVEFMLEGSDVTLDMVYIVPGAPLPQPLLDHDVALVAVAESSENQAVLREIATIVKSWPRPVLNVPNRIARLTRDGTWELLKSAPDVAIPMNARVTRTTLVQIAGDSRQVEDILAGSTFPIIVRPIDSHAGEGLAKLDNQVAIDTYLVERTECEFYIAPFVDYRSADGLFRKYRIALIESKPYACHMAISKHWMIHYLNAEMRERPERRAEEARFMAEFDDNFAVRHATAFNAIAERFDLDYIPIDCGETREGKLLVFEAGTNMIVHAMDPLDLFPYKRPQMEKVFSAFQSMLQKRAMQSVISENVESHFAP